jgi:hypothetical protein
LHGSRAVQARSSVRSTYSRHGINGKANGLCCRTISEPASKAARIAQANDWRSNLVSANELKELLNEAPDSLLEIARADVHVDDLKAAFREIEQFTRMGQSADLLATSSDFAPLLKNANFARIQNAMKANQSLISTGSTAFQLSGFLLVCLFYPRKPPWIRLPSAKPSRKITEVHDLFRFVAFLKVTFEWLTSVHTAPRAFSLGSQRTYLWTNIALACNT